MRDTQSRVHFTFHVFQNAQVLEQGFKETIASIRRISEESRANTCCTPFLRKTFVGIYHELSCL